ncbi:MAG: type IV secretion system protein [Pseudomonadota bacterium]
MNHQSDIDFADQPVAASWAVSVTDDLKRSSRRAWIVAFLVALIALLEALALVFLVPLKSVEPYTLLVDRQTGNVETLAPLNAQSVSPDEALTRSFLVQYVIARESFTSDTIQDDYRKVSLWSDNTVAQGYQGLMAANNPQSPLAYLRRGSVIRTEVKSLSSLANGRSMVRFATRVVDARGRSQTPEHWVALISFGFKAAAMSENDRYLNPLGFQVTAYRRDPETLPEEGIINGTTLVPEPGGPGASPGAAP